MLKSYASLRRSRVLSSLGLVLGLTACVADIAQEGPASEVEHAELSDLAAGAQVDAALTTDVHAEIVSVKLSGSCADASVSTFDGVVDVIASAELSSASCRIQVELDVPFGYRLSMPAAQLELSHASPRSSAKWTARQRYGNQPRFTSERLGTEQNVSEGTWTISSRGTPLSPSCQGTRVSYELELSARNFAFAPLDRVLLPFRYDRGVRIERCGGGRVVPPASAADGFCGGASGHPCAPELSCDRGQLTFDETGDGRCVDPSASTEPAAYKDLCGGAQKTACATGLQCVWAARDSIEDPRVHGICLEHFSAELEPCGGHPDVGCDDGLTCWRSVFATDSAFGNCRPTLGKKEGDVCGGTPELLCDVGLSCAGGVCLRTDGEVGARCGVEGLVCKDELTCFHNSCQDWSAFPESAARGEKCGAFVKLRCQPGLSCDVLGVCN
jgi:hypothetical protein